MFEHEWAGINPLLSPLAHCQSDTRNYLGVVKRVDAALSLVR